MLKPLAGSGGLGTWRISTHEQLELALDLLKPSLENAVLLEEHLDGQELCIDTVTIADEPRFYSLCTYRPTILEALEDPRVQWRCVMPRDMTAERYRDFIEQGLAAVRALAVGNAMTHLEGFLLEGGRICFTDATLRPAGARIGPMLAFAYDIDPYRVWARVAVDGCFDGPWKRKYAVGTVFLRGVGQGRVQRVEGLEEVRAAAWAMRWLTAACRRSAVRSLTPIPVTDISRFATPKRRRWRHSWTSSRTRCKSRTVTTISGQSKARPCRGEGCRAGISIGSIASRPGMMIRCRVLAKRNEEEAIRESLAQWQQGEAP